MERRLSPLPPRGGAGENNSDGRDSPDPSSRGPLADISTSNKRNSGKNLEEIRSATPLGTPPSASNPIAIVREGHEEQFSDENVHSGSVGSEASSNDLFSSLFSSLTLELSSSPTQFQHEMETASNSDIDPYSPPPPPPPPDDPNSERRHIRVPGPNGRRITTTSVSPRYQPSVSPGSTSSPPTMHRRGSLPSGSPGPDFEYIARMSGRWSKRSSPLLATDRADAERGRSLKTSEDDLADLVSQFLHADDNDPRGFYSGLKQIGAGATGMIFKATDNRNNRQVAIKQMPLLEQADAANSEMGIMKKIRHTHIVDFIDNHVVDGNVWVVMELMDAGSLADILELFDQGVRMTEPEISHLCSEVLTGLKHMHALNVVHRDIKSDNVLINWDGLIKLADFGLSAELTDGAKRTAVIGTPYWMPPEAIQGKEYDVKVDVWSMGIMLMEMCEGEPPYMALDHSRAMVWITTKGIPPLVEEEKWSPELKTFLSWCLTIDPTKRPSSAELLNDIFLVHKVGASGIVDLLTRAKNAANSLRDMLAGL